ncbi:MULTISPECIES: hypothetical protein [Actinosynnema]|uniref:hypothetical protein n=1 Tax=Actinosynnema TaxID=40566 RepID=UPI0020A4FF15|nr:hypothetical protein [Actinosynnema pretiosum]
MKRSNPVLVVVALLGALVGPLFVFSETKWGVAGLVGLVAWLIVSALLLGRLIMFPLGIVVFMLSFFALGSYVEPWWYELRGEKVDGCLVLDERKGKGGRTSPDFFVHRVQCGDDVLVYEDSGMQERVEVGSTVSLIVDRGGLLPPVMTIPNRENAPLGPYALGGYLLLTMGHTAASVIFPPPVQPPKPSRPPRGPKFPLKKDST